MVQQNRERGGCLSIWLILGLGASIVGVVGGALYFQSATSIRGGSYTPVVILFVLLGILQFVSVIGMIRWQRWAAYLYAGVSIISLLLAAGLGTSGSNLTAGVGGLIFFYLMIRRKWELFD